MVRLSGYMKSIQSTFKNSDNSFTPLLFVQMSNLHQYMCKAKIFKAGNGGLENVGEEKRLMRNLVDSYDSRDGHKFLISYRQLIVAMHFRYHAGLDGNLRKTTFQWDGNGNLYTSRFFHSGTRRNMLNVGK